MPVRLRLAIFAVPLILHSNITLAIRDTEVADFATASNDHSSRLKVDDPPPEAAAGEAGDAKAGGHTYEETQKGAEQVNAKVSDVDKSTAEAEKKAKDVDAGLRKYSESISHLKGEVDGLDAEAKKFHKSNLEYLLSANSPKHSPLAQFAEEAKNSPKADDAKLGDEKPVDKETPGEEVKPAEDEKAAQSGDQKNKNDDLMKKLAAMRNRQKNTEHLHAK
eukprot:TRINITY_DN81071_c0_g1_i1.p1 TRINITY_DN81071_c0_g1~~TRINITY_DN81071_c0_g1_i1.p1  ORF type:complete len:220 (-),score=69.21 TRINITY_DN81071_c0_g1_i1:143-802(-)